MIRKKFWRLLYAVIISILNVRVQYLRGEIPIPQEDGILLQIFGYLIAIPFFLIVAWFWDEKYIYNYMVSNMSRPLSYETYLILGTGLFFLLAVFFITTSFIFPVPTTYHYGR